MRLTSDSSTRTSPWSSRDFRLLVTGASTSALGNAITPVALAFAVLDLGGNASELGLVVAAFALTEVVTTLVGGVIGDRLPRQVVMQGSAAASVVTQAVMAVSLVVGFATIPLLTVLGALTGAMSALSGPSSQAMIRATVAPEQIGTAVALRSTLSNAAMITGFAMGGLLVAGVGPGWAIGVDAVTYAVAAACYAALHTPHVPAEGSGGSMLGELGDGLREVRRHVWLVLLIGMALLYHLVYGGAQGVLGPIVVRDRFGTADWGWALSALMVGFLAGSLLCLRWRPRHGLRIGTAMLALTSAFPLAMAYAHQLPLLLLGAAVHGFGLMIFDVNWETSIQQHVPEDKLSRVFAFDIVGSFVARPVGLALTGPVASAVGFSTWLLVVGSVMAGASLLCLLSPDVWRLERTDARDPIHTGHETTDEIADETTLEDTEESGPLSKRVIQATIGE